MLDEKVIQSYVFYEDKAFFVSTIERDSSAMLGPGRYYETIVWEWDTETRERGKIICQEGTHKGDLKQHFLICKVLRVTGKWPEDEEE